MDAENNSPFDDDDDDTDDDDAPFVANGRTFVFVSGVIGDDDPSRIVPLLGITISGSKKEYELLN